MKSLVKYGNIPVITVVVAVFAVFGVVMLFSSFAATGEGRGFEAEGGSVAGAAKKAGGTGVSDAEYVQLNSGNGAGGKPRVIIMTDGEIDDKDSMLRFLLYTNEVDLKGIVETNSCWQRSGHSNESWLEELLDAYEDVRPNLLQHNSEYPTADFLRSISVVGQENESTLFQGMPQNDTPGSELILAEMRKNDPRPLYINAWGGSNTTAHALYKLKTQFPNEYSAASAKVKLHTIHSPDCPIAPGQDGGWKWIGDNIPGTEVIVDRAFNRTWDYWGDENPYDAQYKSKESRWIITNVKENHGPLGAEYEQDYTSEGDTPAFLWFVQNGLRGEEHPTWGGWGGRYKLERGNLWVDAQDDGNVKKPLWRWFPAAQHDFAARMDWTVKSFAEANHPPAVPAISSPSQTVAAGSTVTLSTQVADPDGDNLAVQWWQYNDADTAGAVTINNATSANAASFTVPNEPGKTIHIILEITDDGEPSLKSYGRYVFTIAQ